MSLPRTATTSALLSVAGAIPFACVFIVLNEFCERFAYYGGSAPFQNYVQRFPVAQASADVAPGAFGLGQALATLWNQYFTFIAYTSPILGAFISDQYLGKFRTIIIFATIYMVGWLVLTVSAIPDNYLADGTPVFKQAGYGMYITAITIIGLGTGGIKALVSPMCADQIPKEPYVFTKKEYKLKSSFPFFYTVENEYIADPDMTIQSVYNWFYWAINLGAVFGSIICTRAELTAFWIAYLIPTCMFVLAIVSFAVGYKYYIQVAPEGSIYITSYKCISHAMRAKKAAVGTSEELTIPVGTNFGFLEYAKARSGDKSTFAWRDTFPEELRQTLKACSIFPLMTIYWVAYSQMTGNLISQAGEMAKPDWITNDVVNNVDPVVLIILIPFFDKFIYPYMARHNIQFGYIKRITTGIVLGGLSMVVAAIIQHFIYVDPVFLSQEDDPEGLGVPSSVSIYWQFLAYALIAVSEIFASIGSLEYSYTHAPESMKGFVSALSLFPNAGAAAIGIAISPYSIDPSVLWVYVGAGIACFVTAVLFYVFFRTYDAEDLQIKQDKMKAGITTEDTLARIKSEMEIPLEGKM